VPYLNLDLEYFDHPKTRRLVGLLGRNAEVLPLRLWNYCGRFHSEDGRLTGYSAQEIESLVEWWGRPGEALSAMIKVGFIQPLSDGFIIHDWKNHQGHIKALRDRASHAAKQRWALVRSAQKPDGREHPPNAASIATGNAPGSARASPKQSSILKPLTTSSALQNPLIPEGAEETSKGNGVTVNRGKTVKSLSNGSGLHGSRIQGAFSQRFLREGWEPITEAEFMALLIEVAEGMGDFGGRWRKRWREHRSLCLDALAALRVELLSKSDIERPGGWLNSTFEEFQRANENP